MKWVTSTIVTPLSSTLRSGPASPGALRDRARSGWVRPVLGLAQVTADTNLVTLQLPIATGGGRILTAQEAAHYQ